MSSYEERIQENDEDLYAAIKDYVKEIPDLRPLETVNLMKKTLVGGKETIEPQNNWRMVYEEIFALTSSFSYKHRDFLNTVIHNDMKRFALYFVDDRLLHAVFQSYPALVWLLQKISPEECTWALYISQNEYLSLVPMEPECVKYIKRFETVNGIRELYPDWDLWPYIEEFLYEENVNPPFLGYLYWFHLVYKDQYSDFIAIINTLIIRNDDMVLARAFFPLLPKDSWNSWGSNSEIIKEASEEMINYLVEEMETPDDYLILLAEDAVYMNNMPILFLSFERFDEDMTGRIATNMFSRGLEKNDMSLIILALEKAERKKIDYVDNTSLGYFIILANEARFTFLLDNLDKIVSPKRILQSILALLIKRERQDLLSILLKREDVIVNNKYLLLTLDTDNVPIIKELLKKVDENPNEFFPTLLKRALLKKAKRIIMFILSYSDLIISQDLEEKAKAILAE